MHALSAVPDHGGRIAPINLEIIWQVYPSQAVKGEMRRRPLDVVNHDKERRVPPDMRDAVLARYGVTFHGN